MVKIDTKHKFNSALIGMILFDGSLSENKYLYIRHGGKQLSYVDEKVEFIKKYIKPRSIRTCTDKQGFVYRYAYYYDKRFKYLGKKIYKNGKKVLTKNILNRFDEITLAIMYMDDGCLGLRKDKKSKKGERVATTLHDIAYFCQDLSETVRHLWIQCLTRCCNSPFSKDLHTRILPIS